MQAMLQVYCPRIDRKGCAQELVRALARLRGVESVETDFSHHRVTVRYDNSRVADGPILRTLAAAGYRS